MNRLKIIENGKFNTTMFTEEQVVFIKEFAISAYNDGYKDCRNYIKKSLENTMGLIAGFDFNFTSKK